ncbi:hypothetical protein LOK49_LG11G00209 [Camellia lanceoleosa]|uniref:Uncharacterized protein n=1 Tax=Camellia lanceoleosa TaxID=1840588 RepID=A0ACC0G3F5_9ERIC|nr:hypothetical protein LOK49_LG11G00209 [Camellia lanceoleosa]
MHPEQFSRNEEKLRNIPRRIQLFMPITKMVMKIQHHSQNPSKYIKNIKVHCHFARETKIGSNTSNSN